ncbi:hypothetical protein AB6A40_005808 [Gnathostoma spinigerum]|uniref:EGF-like domain-containing protein n=1 Tax=Gnathostoma spinigerum TaxID=75299 RepID=A0ABD6EP68_9BILA
MDCATRAAFSDTCYDSLKILADLLERIAKNSGHQCMLGISLSKEVFSGVTDNKIIEQFEQDSGKSKESIVKCVGSSSCEVTHGRLIGNSTDKRKKVADDSKGKLLEDAFVEMTTIVQQSNETPVNIIDLNSTAELTFENSTDTAVNITAQMPSDAKVLSMNTVDNSTTDIITILGIGTINGSSADNITNASIDDTDERVLSDLVATIACNDRKGCDCPSGFVYVNATASCDDIDECLTAVHYCSQRCINEIGSYHCQCNPEYFGLASDGKKCLMKDNVSMWLIFAHGESIWNVSSDGKQFDMLMGNLAKVTSLDIDMKAKSYYFTESALKVLERADLHGSSHEIQSYEVDGQEGIAVDWIGRNLYSLRRTDVFVQTLDGRFRKKLYDGKFRLPRALVAHSLIGQLFASDWSSSAFIARLSMDGSSFIKIITEAIIWPNAIAIDIFADRIYWADSYLDKIESCDFDGAQRHVVISDPGSVPHVFGLTVFGDNLYWTDWTYRGILTANKHNGENLTVLAQTASLPYSVKAFHPSVQPSHTNPCKKIGCHHLCLIMDGGEKGKCACSDGFALKKDELSCQSQCRTDEILCGGSDPRCISIRYLCDGIVHCADQSDETDCQRRVCMPGQFQCHSDKRCIPEKAICDGVAQCADGSDEKHC